jgi:hypothetical protein
MRGSKMNIDNWLKKSKNIKISKKNKKVIIENESDCEGMVFSTNIIKCKKINDCFVVNNKYQNLVDKNFL